MTRNEAAGRLLGYIVRDVTNTQRAEDLLNEALAAERRATVRRIRKAMFGRREVIRGDVPALQLHELLEQEEQR